MKKIKNKIKSIHDLKKHAMKRFLERYDRQLLKTEYEFFNNMINKSSPNAVFLRKGSNRITIWNLKHDGKEYFVAYDKIRHGIVSFLPTSLKEKGEKYEVYPNNGSNGRSEEVS